MENSHAIAVLDHPFGQITMHRMRILAGVLMISAHLLMPGYGLASEPRVPEQRTDLQTVLETGSIAQWLKVQFSAAELQQLRVGDVEVDAHYCGCFDEPVKHYPYSVVVIRTTRGDLIMRPESVEVAVRFSPLAVRYGDRYCDVDSGSCYGVFSEVCAFTDFRYGPYLAEFFPTCKANEPQSTITVDGFALQFQ
jgi:hypothetical protein